LKKFLKVWNEFEWIFRVLGNAFLWRRGIQCSPT
jgi:hypothetical protein